MFWRSRLLSRSSAAGIAVALMAGLVSGLSAPGAAGVRGMAYVVIASPDVPVADLSLAECRRICLLERTIWKPGLQITLLLPEASQPARSFMLRHIYHRDDIELRRMFLEKLFQGRIDYAPKVAHSDREAVSLVASAHGLLTLVPADTPGLDHVRVLSIDGKLPGQPNYPLSD